MPFVLRRDELRCLVSRSNQGGGLFVVTAAVRASRAT